MRFGSNVFTSLHEFCSVGTKSTPRVVERFESILAEGEQILREITVVQAEYDSLRWREMREMKHWSGSDNSENSS